jgi:hypothetical protein
MYMNNQITLESNARSIKSLFQAGPAWKSFENFRKSGPAGLSPVQGGKVGLLTVKQHQYRIISDSDFQFLLGLATEVSRLQKGLKVVISAAHVVERHSDSESFETLKAALELIVDFDAPTLPMRDSFDSITPEEGLIDTSNDEVELEQVSRPTTVV